MDGPGLKSCAGCSECIFDQFFLCVADKAYHSHCLKCSLCQTVLEDEMTCYFKEGRIFCKFDYYKRYRSARCSGCNCTINADELVMRMSDMVYHLACFRCCICTETLQTGEQYGVGENAQLFCHRHMNCLPQYPPPLNLFPPRNNTTNDKIKPEKSGNGKVRGRKRRSTLQLTNPPDDHFVSCELPPMTDCLNGMTSLTNINQIVPMHLMHVNHNSNLSELTSSPENDGANSTASEALLHASRHESSSPTSSTTTNNNSLQQHRTKRMRTSFKHQQLRQMKQYFLLNHNPDAKDLKNLAQKTGLTKRVLQVWFQNARAKYRRSMLKQSDRDGNQGGDTDGVDNKTHSLSPQTESLPSFGEMQNSV